MQATLILLIAAAGAAYMYLRYSRRLPGASGARAGVTDIDAVGAAELIEAQKAVVVDVRTAAEYAAGRIPRATHIPLRQLPQHVQSLKKYQGRPIVVSCRTGHRSASACAYLARNGFEEVYNLKGGLRAWARARQAIEGQDR